MYRGGKISDEGSKTLGNTLLYLSLPCVIVSSFLTERTQERVTAFGLSALAALVVLLISILISQWLLGKNAIDIIAGAFSNVGFFGVPLITAYLSSEDVFYIVPFIAFLNLFQWTYGVTLLQKSDENGRLEKNEHREAKKQRFQQPDTDKQAWPLIKKIITAPFMIAILSGSVIFFTGISLPSVFVKCINHIANVNTPLAMFSVGTYLAQTDLVKMFAKGRLYYISLVRMILIPAATILVLCPIPNSMLNLKMSILIASACPVGSNVAVYAQLHGKDYSYAVETVVISTVLSIAVIPLMVGIGGWIWN